VEESLNFVPMRIPDYCARRKGPDTLFKKEDRESSQVMAPTPDK